MRVSAFVVGANRRNFSVRISGTFNAILSMDSERQAKGDAYNPKLSALLLSLMNFKN